MNEMKEQLRTIIRFYHKGAYSEEFALTQLLQHLGVKGERQNPIPVKKVGQFWCEPAKDGSGFYVGTCVRPDAYSEIVQVGTFVNMGRVLRVMSTIRQHFDLPYTHSTNPKDIPLRCKFSLPSLAPILIEHYSLPVAVDAFNGGMTNRNKYYLPYYYWPLKVLDWKGDIRFGNISWRLK